jgi:two-component system response regulator PilR (NtrC family)
MMVQESEPPHDPGEDRPVVLCVDDERPILAALVRTLRDEPYCVIATDDPEEALERVRSQSVRLILADYRMRLISGTSLLQMVKAASPSTIRVLLTAHAGDDLVQAAADNGLMEVWPKPWDDQRLRDLLRELIRDGATP